MFDIYPDRVVFHEKPVYFAYKRPDTVAFYNFNYGKWTTYKEARKAHPYLLQGPLTVERE